LDGALGTEAVAGVTDIWSTLDKPWSETANCVIELTPALRWTCSAECWYTSKLPVIGKLWVVVMTVPLTFNPIWRLLTPGNRPPWNAYRQSTVYRPAVGTTTLLNVIVPSVA
jgi:hypothetical protein